MLNVYHCGTLDNANDGKGGAQIPNNDNTRYSCTGNYKNVFVLR